MNLTPAQVEEIDGNTILETLPQNGDDPDTPEDESQLFDRRPRRAARRGCRGLLDPAPDDSRHARRSRCRLLLRREVSRDRCVRRRRHGIADQHVTSAHRRNSARRKVALHRRRRLDRIACAEVQLSMAEEGAWSHRVERHPVGQRGHLSPHPCRCGTHAESSRHRDERRVDRATAPSAESSPILQAPTPPAGGIKLNVGAATVGSDLEASHDDWGGTRYPIGHTPMAAKEAGRDRVEPDTGSGQA